MRWDSLTVHVCARRRRSIEIYKTHAPRRTLSHSFSSQAPRAGRCAEGGSTLPPRAHISSRFSAAAHCTLRASPLLAHSPHKCRRSPFTSPLAPLICRLSPHRRCVAPRFSPKHADRRGARGGVGPGGGGERADAPPLTSIRCRGSAAPHQHSVSRIRCASPAFGVEDPLRLTGIRCRGCAAAHQHSVSRIRCASCSISLVMTALRASRCAHQSETWSAGTPRFFIAISAIL
jgi:hypothetical protein